MTTKRLTMLVQIGEVDPTTRSIALEKTLPEALVDESFTGTFEAVDATGAVTYSITDGAVPSGYSLDSGTGVLSGSTSDQDFYEFEVTATDGALNSTSVWYSLTVGSRLRIDQTALPEGEYQTDYTATLSATGGVAPYTYSVVDGAIPDGLSLVGDTISGTADGHPTFQLTYSFAIRVTDANGHFAEQPFNVIVWPELGVDPSNYEYADGFVGSSYSYRIGAVHGGAYTNGPSVVWSVDAAELPPGLTLSPKTGTISGAPTTAGEYELNLTLTDSLGATFAHTDIITIRQPGYATESFAQAFGDGVATSFTIPHPFLTEDVQVQIFENTVGSIWEEIDCEFTVDAVEVNITTKRVPPTNGYRLVVIG